MSGLEVFGGILASASIALQLADMAVKLHSFWKSFKDCPREMRDLLSDLLLLQRVLKDIHAEESLLSVPREALPTHEPLLKCEAYFRELEALAHKLQADISKGKVKRTWKSVKVVFQSEDLRRFKENLESMKVTLVLARQSLASMLSARNNAIVASHVGTISSQQVENIRAIQMMEMQLEEDTRAIVDTINARSQNMYPKPVMTTLESAIKAYIYEGLKENIQDLRTGLETRHDDEPRVQSEETNSDNERSNDESTCLRKPSPSQVSTESADQGALHSACVQRADTFDKNTTQLGTQHVQTSSRKRYNSIFGVVEINVKFAVKISKTSSFGVERTEIERKIHALLSFKPESWLARSGIWTFELQKTTSRNGHEFNIQPSYNAIVPHSSPIFQACQNGDVAKVINLLGSGQASVNDIDEWGRGLMHMAARSRSTSLIKTLIREGCVKGAVDDFGSSPLDMVPIFEKGRGKPGGGFSIAEDRLIDIVRLLIEEADCDPNFEYFENRCSNNMLQNLCKYRRVLDIQALTPIMHYLLTQETFFLESSSHTSDQPREFNALSDVLYHTERGPTDDMTDLVQKRNIGATFVADFGYSVMQDALMQGHECNVVRAAILSGAWLHTKTAEAQTPTRMAWWKEQMGEASIPFGASRESVAPKNSLPKADYEIFEFLRGNGNFSRALQDCGIDLWEFSCNEARVLASTDNDEPLQYLTNSCYHRPCVDSSYKPEMWVPIVHSLPVQRKSHIAEDP